MLPRILTVGGWILLIAEAVLVVAMIVQRDSGDDAAGSWASRAMGLLGGAAVVAAGALFLWGQRGGPRPAFWAGLGLAALPLLIFFRQKASGAFTRFDLATGHAHYRKFADHRLTLLARAIERDDTDGVRTLLAEGRVDFAARNRNDQTLLGLAVEHALGATGTGAALESVRLLLAAGARPLPDVMRREPYAGEPDSHLLVAHVFGHTSPNALPLLDLLLGAGADPNTRNHDGQPLYLSLDATLPKLQLLARHGADFSALETTRSDRYEYTAAMVAAELGRWDMIEFFTTHGVSRNHVAPDGSSLQTIIARKASGR